jgi:outer membrane protein TolC
LEVTNRALDLRTARAAARVAEQALTAAQENLRVTRDRYLEGVISSSDFLDAEVMALRAGLERTDALARLRLAHVSLGRAVGESAPTPSEGIAP